MPYYLYTAIMLARPMYPTSAKRRLEVLWIHWVNTNAPPCYKKAEGTVFSPSMRLIITVKS